MLRLMCVGFALAGTLACGGSDYPIPTTPTMRVAEAERIFRASGTVVEIGGGPVAEATVSARSCDDTPSPNHIFGQTSTDANGEFLIQVESGSELPIGCVYLQAEKPGYVTKTDRSQPTAGRVRIDIQRLRRVTGRLVEIDGGPVAGATVFATRSSPAATTNAAGFFTLDGVGRSVLFSKDGYVDRALGVPEGHDGNLGTVYIQRTIALAPGKRVVSRISSADLAFDFYDMWDVEEFCNPCKSIDVASGQQNLEIHLQWEGDTPLALWASSDLYNGLPSRTAPPGQSSLTVLIPAETRVLLVGIKSQTFELGQPLDRPVTFEITARAQ